MIQKKSYTKTKILRKGPEDVIHFSMKIEKHGTIESVLNLKIGEKVNGFNEVFLMDKEEFQKKDKNLDKLLKTIDKKEYEFWENYWDEDAMPNDLLDEAKHIIILQKNAIRNLLVKIKILEEKI
ncbi:hypothetical protein QUW36_01825 [Clostridium cadaveris]|uniref:hypothetical protein n=1 Tax=Clostridium cadaveris TaxID=1529 RepID=UPI0025A434EA|nr:hypothetical protein [Clostridium cadaveris]MDM8310787.1 hypothetical protein [Clostridium cadaveris]